MENLTHLDSQGNAIMIDVSQKNETRRRAIACGRIFMNNKAYVAISEGTVLKGDVLASARIAGIMATKQTPSLIPLCHSLLLTSSKVDFRFLEEVSCLEATCTVETEGRTGVEMEALTGVTIALLTIYDFGKALDRGMQIEDIHLVFKEGGKSGTYDKR